MDVTDAGVGAEPPNLSFLSSLPLAREAWRWAWALHAGQRRDSDAAPFVVHPLEVGALLRNSGHSETVVAAGILHDAVEKTSAKIAHVDERFGSKVAGIVAAVTEDPAIEPYEERKASLRRQVAASGEGATAVYAADKIAKVRELRARVSSAEQPFSLDDQRAQLKLAHYHASLEMLEAKTPDRPLVRQLRFELEVLEVLPPGRSRRRQ